MESFAPFIKVALYGVMAVSLIAAIGVVTLRNLFHAAIALVVVLLGIAGIFFSLHAEFLAIAQILIYVGAVMTLVIFAIMLTERFGDKSIRQNNNLGIPALIVSVVFLVAMTRLILHTNWPERQAEGSVINTFDLGNALMNTYVFPFEIISIILIVALIGSVVVAKKDPS